MSLAIMTAASDIHHQITMAKLLVDCLVPDRYVATVHVFVHALGYVVCEEVDLFSDVSEPRVARPSANQHDCVD